MKALKDRIVRDGRAMDGGVLKVDSFLNHQLDAQLMLQIALEFERRLDQRGISVNKIVTIEASGIAPAIMMGYVMGLPVVFAKKKTPRTMGDYYVTRVHSFTKDRDYDVCIDKRYLRPGDRVFFVDDFLAYGNAALGIADLCRQSGATLASMGFIIEKGFQGGGDALRRAGHAVISLAIIDRLTPGHVEFREGRE